MKKRDMGFIATIGAMVLMILIAVATPILIVVALVRFIFFGGF